MNKKLLISVLLCFFVFFPFMPLNAQWARTYGESSSDYGYGIQQTSDGGYITVGWTESFGAGESDVWILKLSSNGAIDWQRTYGGSSSDYGYGIQQTSDGGYIVAAETYSFGAGGADLWILKLSSTGAIDWQRTYGGIDLDWDPIIQQTSDGGYIVVAHTLSFGAGYYDIWVLKLSSTGEIDWQRTYGGSSSDYAWWVQQTSDGGYIIAAETYSFGAGKDDAWILKLSSTGAIEWQRTYGGIDRDWGQTIQQTSDGGYILSCGTLSFGAGSWDFWILKLSSTGAIEWQRTYGGSSSDWSGAIVPISDGGYIVTGLTFSFGAGEYDVWVFKLSLTGAIEWQRTYGGNDSDRAYLIEQTSDEGYIIASHTSSFGAGEYDVWVLKLYSDGDIDPSCGFIGSSNASVINTYVSPGNTNITPGSTYVTPLDTICLTRDTDATANLLCAREHSLTISANTGGTTDPASGSHAYIDGTEVQVEAIPDSGYEFSSWSGDASGTANPITITMDSDKSIIANFTLIPPPEEAGKKGGCFIATAAYGSPLHYYVGILQKFRDKYVMPNKLGRSLVSLYYKYSPSVADVIVKHKVLKVVVRISLLPLIALSYTILHFGLTITAILGGFIFLIPIFFVWFCQRKIRRVEAKDPKALASPD
jgi:hypothetical protein